MVTTRWDKHCRVETAEFRKHCTRAQIDDFVKHIFREHNQDADHIWTSENQRAETHFKRRSEEHIELECGPWFSGTVAKKISVRVAVAL